MAYFISKECVAFGACEPECPVQAITLNEEAIAVINPDMCCGCGQCALHCPEEVIQLKTLERDVFLPILEESKRRI